MSRLLWAQRLDAEGVMAAETPGWRSAFTEASRCAIQYRRKMVVVQEEYVLRTWSGRVDVGINWRVELAPKPGRG